RVLIISCMDFKPCSSEGRSTKAEGTYEPTFKNVGRAAVTLCISLYASRYNSLFKLGFIPRTKVFINTSFLLPSALCHLPFFVTIFLVLVGVVRAQISLAFNCWQVFKSSLWTSRLPSLLGCGWGAFTNIYFVE
ncbi:hypothetical protein, partial [Tolypothrix sp. NIES-4075]|uniref:hypothetical protein n=1 Tax=Tolypothrix sp. NIES-4075 TaxID=2005459 RepID=UPI001F1F5CE0